MGLKPIAISGLSNIFPIPMKHLLLSILTSFLFLAGYAQDAPKPYGPLPSERQLHWQETEMYCIIHFGPDTYTNKEWGYGDEDPKIFNPTQFSAMQIVGAVKAGGFKGIVVVAKHHDGFCLWPTKTTDHNISASPYKGGKGDIVQEYRDACNKLGIKMGVYCSPWDRNSAFYGKPEYVTNVYRKQLVELYTHYGPIFISWFDGANGGDGYYGGTREVRKIDRSTYYGWDTTWAIPRKLAPGAVLFGDVGPDVRWVGNEAGHAGATCWETYTPHAPDAGKKPGNGYSKDYEGTEGQRDGQYWMPAECDVPLRPGWFYHSEQDNKVKSPDSLVNLYYMSVGRGACLDLGLSPDRRGLLFENDVQALQQFGDIIRQTFAVNLAAGATLKASNIRGGNAKKFGPEKLLDTDRYSYWATDDGVTTPSLTADLHKSVKFNVVRLRENTKLGQRIDAVAVDAFIDGKWQEIGTATSIGANRLIRLPKAVTADKVRLRITKAPVCIALSDFGLYLEPGKA
jgi:alpha-L-fucosidase